MIGCLLPVIVYTLVYNICYKSYQLCKSNSNIINQNIYKPLPQSQASTPSAQV